MSKETTIYASIDDAMRLKKAGFGKECVHTAHFTEGQIIVFAYDATIQEIDNNTFLNDVVLQLPTLQEIDLPENFAIYKTNRGYEISCLFDANVDCLIFESDTPKFFETELQARIEAYIWAKQNLLEPNTPNSYFALWRGNYQNLPTTD